MPSVNVIGPLLNMLPVAASKGGNVLPNCTTETWRR